MKDILVNKTELLGTLQRNRTEHQEIFAEAEKGYHLKAIGLLRAELDKAEKGEEFKTYIELTKPASYVKEYDRIIGMLKMSEEPLISLSEQDYRNFVLDEWQWSGTFYASNVSYSAKASSKFPK